jgi:shikimate dehydrogenase
LIDGHTQLVGLIGWPVEHSLSPAMHNAAFDALDLNWRYVPLPVVPGRVDEAIRGLAGLGFRGANVTVPHKRAAYALVDEAGPSARALGAANTLLIERDDEGEATIGGHNTDVRGFVHSLRSGGYDPAQGRSAVVVGAGGSARAVVYGLLAFGESRICVLNRTHARAQALVADLGASPAWRARLQATPLSAEALVESARQADLLVNTTTVGMWPHTGRSVWPDDASLPAALTVFDLVYNPPETKLLSQARRSGVAAIGGLEMLVQQGALAFDIWTGGCFEVDAIAAIMRDTCRLHLQA